MNPDRLICKHCGSHCDDNSIRIDKNIFCCNGCKTVYEILSDNNLSGFYEISKGEGGFRPNTYNSDKFSFLENSEISEKLKTFTINGKSKVSFNLPQIHCSACIWLLENLPQLKEGILDSKVNFPNKEVDILFDEEIVSLKALVELLATIGYTPKLDLTSLDKKNRIDPNKSLYIKLGIAGFCFGNLMMLAFPEYLTDTVIESGIENLINILNLIFILPLLFASSDYLKSAYYGLKTKNFNIDVPITVGIIVLTLRSIFDIVYGNGSGFVDSLGGLIFFLLLGKTFQQKTYNLLAFDRDYKSFFPLSVIRIKNELSEHIQLKNILIGDELFIRNKEIIPTDGVLLNKKALIDYSFVTGEAMPVEVQKNKKVFAGGKIIGQSANVIATEEFDQSYLTKLWNNSAFEKFNSKGISRLSNIVAKYFSIVVVLIAVISFFVWLPIDKSIAFNVLTSVLIVACPCALALTLPFTYGQTMRVLGRNNFFLKSDLVVELLSKVNTIVFDKTGTLTRNTNSIIYSGTNIDDYLDLIYSTVTNSTHPISSMIKSLIFEKKSDIKLIELVEFKEYKGKGVFGSDATNTIRIGSSAWICPNPESAENSTVLEVNGIVFGAFNIQSQFRKNIFLTLKRLFNRGYKLSILSGDNQKDEKLILENIDFKIDTYFNKLPDEKLNYITDIQSYGSKVAMVGDGLNDSGGLAKADVGIAIAEETSNFTPGSDAILLASEISKLPKFLKLSKTAIKISYASIIISFLYNIIGISFAVFGLLSPLVAAILMPISSITVILFTVTAVSLSAKKYKL